MAARPTVSVLLPAFDAERTLPAALRSLVRQSLRSWECVIVDDGSRDGTLEIAKTFGANDARFRVVAIEHAGLIAALNAGIDRCRGSFVARMDADDLMRRRRLERQAAALAADPSLAAVGCHVRLWPRTEMTAGLRAYESWLGGMTGAEDLRRDAFIECPIAHPTLVIRRSVLEAHRYRDRGWPEDWDLVLRLLAADERIGVVPERLHCWRDGALRLQRTDARYGQDRFTACRAAHLAASFLRGVETYVLWGYGTTGRTLARALRAHGKHPSHIVELHPGRLGNTIHGAPVIPPEALAALADVRILASVAGPEPRALIRAALEAQGRIELEDFVCVA